MGAVLTPRHRRRAALAVAAAVVGVLAGAGALAGTAGGASVTGTFTIGCDGWSSTGDVLGGEPNPVEGVDITGYDGFRNVIYQQRISGLTGTTSVALGQHPWTTPPQANHLTIEVKGASSSATTSAFIASSVGSCAGLPWVPPTLQVQRPWAGDVPGEVLRMVGDGCGATTAYLQLVQGDRVVSTVSPIAVPSAENAGHAGFDAAWSAPVPVPPGLDLAADVSVRGGCGTPGAPTSATSVLAISPLYAQFTGTTTTTTTTVSGVSPVAVTAPTPVAAQPAFTG